MCRDDDHGGRRCPSSQNKTKRSEQNRAYYQSRKNGARVVREAVAEPLQLSSLPSPAVMTEFFNRKAETSPNNFYVWADHSGPRINEWDTASPEIHAESQQFVDSIRETFANSFDNGESSYSLQTTSVSLNAAEDGIWGRTPMSADVEGSFLDDDGNKMGSWQRIVYFPENAPPFADYRSLTIYPSYQGKGLGRKAITFFDTTMRSWGVENVEVEANVDVGGYAWAKSGYDWDTRMGKRVMRELGEEIDAVETWDEQQETIQDNLQEWGDNMGDPDGSIGVMIERLKQPYNAETYPTPFEVSETGKTNSTGQGSIGTSWAGKHAMLRGRWWGVRKL